MKHSPSPFALTVLCMLATAAAAQRTPQTQPVRQGAGSPVAANPAVPGQFTGMTSSASVEINKPLTFQMAGQGYCKLKFDGGDGQVSEVQGKLPFSAEHVYSGASMSSFDAFKNYTAIATPLGNCKTSGQGPFSVAVQAINPTPQSAGNPPKDNTVVLAGAGQLLTPVKPISSGVPPSVAPTITAIVLASKTLTGAPNLAPEPLHQRRWPQAVQRC